MTDSLDTSGRTCNLGALLSQIDSGTVLAITGGRPLLAINHSGPGGIVPTGLLLEQGNGRAVAVVLDHSDTYRVSRIHRGRVVGVETFVYCDELDSSVWRASCFEDGSFGTTA